MSKYKLYTILLLITVTHLLTKAQDIFRFEHYDSKNGLSQNSVSSLMCDKDGFLWIGTMNGLNRFDGYKFKVFDSASENNSFINNRIINIWQDKIGYIWIETYDHYFHYFNPNTETFNTVPEYYNPNFKKLSQATCFLQYSEGEIWIGTNERGIYYLKHNNATNTYAKHQVSDRGRFSITNNDVRFIIADSDSSIWVGTKRGINLLNKQDLRNHSFDYQHFFINYSFNSAIEIDNTIWFGTDKQGLIKFNKDKSSYDFINKGNTPHFICNEINKIYASKNNQILVALNNNGLILFDADNDTWKNIPVNGKNVDEIYFDKSNNAWITTEKFGVTKLDLATHNTKVFQLTDQDQKSITDDERHFFFEDHDNNLWIGLHGGGLAFFDKEQDQFTKYVNEPYNNYSISSNIVHCITEDSYGQIWLGTGQYKGGLDKAVKHNQAFKHISPTSNIRQIIDNVVRCTKQDKNGNLWVCTKNGVIHIYNKDLKKIASFNNIRSNNITLNNANVYSIHFDKNNHVWLGTKGHGLFISQKPLGSDPSSYSKIKFNQWVTNPTDTTSISNNNIYSIEEDLYHNIWVGTYGNGICKTQANNYNQITFGRFNSNNSLLSSNQVRSIKCDSDSNLWVATSFGLNLLLKDSLQDNNIKFRTFIKEVNNPSSINYNDIIEIYEDSGHQLWFGTFGGGVSSVQLPVGENIKFTSITTKSGLSNDVVYGILEDQSQHIWLSSEYGLSRYNKEQKNFEIYNEANGLSFNNFSENTCVKLNDGRIVFGGSEGIEVINPDLLKKPSNNNLIKFTNFQLFNKDVVIGDEKSPLKKSISFTNEIELKHSQSSFSIEYSALDFLDPEKIQYAYKLDGFDNSWNYVGNQTKATYTNLPPGEYTFRVKNTDRSGQWGNYDKELKVVIHPPIWKTTWAYIGYVLLILLTILAIRAIIISINKYRNDLTLEKRISELKVRFFTNISHEIRTPLTLILGPLEDILHEGGISQSVQDQLKLMKKNTQKMLQLVNQLLDFRRIQNNKMSLNIQEVDLSKFTQNIYNSFIPLAKHNGITFQLELPEDKIFIWADIVKLDSIIYNLISNALKFTPKGKKVFITLNDDKNNNAVIRVKDEGPGIADENIEDIFTRYVILNNDDNRSSGIGLSLAFELAKMHGGEITLSSEIGKGSCFSFIIPMDKNKITRLENVTIIDSNENIDTISTFSENEYLPEKFDTKLSDKDKSTILIVEDNDQIADYIKGRLSSLYNCYVSKNGMEGLKMAEIHNPDVIVTDIMMPQMDGIEMTKQLKNNFSLCHIPVIIMTAKTDIKDQIAGYDTGAEAYITKPLNSEHLKAIIQSFINQRKLIISKYRDNKTIDPNTLKVNSKDEEFLQQLLDYIEENHSKDLSVANVSDHFCVSRTVLYNKVKGLTGLSPLELIRQVKLKLSLTFLQKGYSVSETAFKVGYSDVKYFSKQFKLMHGYPPSKVKKEFQK